MPDCFLNFLLEILLANDGSILPLPNPTTAMQCPFCHKECEVSDAFQVPKGLVGYRCQRHPHPVNLIAVPSETHFAYFFTCWYQRREYSIECYKLPEGEQCDFRCGSELIAHFNFIPQHLTPDSIDRRIKTLLIFS